ncbi:MAG: multidrug effflux MFS transporter [Hellea sp.]|nr:multidrug effflux MFS transporter [Hellea sp.]
MPRWEFVTLMAALIALNALAIDTMLPALGLIGDYFSIKNENSQQLVVISYVLGFGAPQLIFGPLTDRYGRVGMLKFCIIGFIVGSFACMLAPTFWALLLIRFLQGVVASGIRVVAVSIVRDLLSGRGMARVMSLIMTVFMIVPIIAPALGQSVMGFSWRWTFGILVLLGAFVLLWVWIRLPETLPVEKRRSINLATFLGTYKTVLSNRTAAGYMAASGVIYGSLFAFISASEQVFRQVFGLADVFALVFGGVAATMAVASFTNSRLVERFGMRRISHGALLCFILFSGLNVALAILIGEKFFLFYPCFVLTFACFGMLGANFNALAMEPHGDNIGAASAAYGFATTTVASLFGWAVGQTYNGTVVPLLWGFVLLGIGSLLIVLITEKGRLFEIGQNR